MNDSDLRDEICTLLNSASRENKSNTPDYILAEYLMACLVAFEQAVDYRDAYNK